MVRRFSICLFSVCLFNIPMAEKRGNRFACPGERAEENRATPGGARRVFSPPE